MRKVTLLILIDGLRYDYLNPFDAPFLSLLARSGISGTVSETFAFQLRPAFFAGLYPEFCNIAHLYWYEPQTSPFKFTRYIPKIILKVPKIKGYYKRFLWKYARLIEARKGNSASSFYADPAEIPYNLLKYFGFSEKNLPWESQAYGNNNLTLFDILRENRLNWLWIAYPTDDQRTDSVVRKFKEEIRKDYSFVYLHFAELDWVGHTYGPHTYEQRRTLRQIDSAVWEIYTEAGKIFDEVNGLIFGDHGMVKVAKSIDIEQKVSGRGLKLEKDFIYFLDSTQARFWFKNIDARKIIEEILNSTCDGRILTDKDYKKLHFRFNHKKFGELIFVANDKTMIFPNFFQRTKYPRGMHGYLPEVQGNWAKFIIFGMNKKVSIVDSIEMVDLFPLILNLMDL